MQAMHVKGMGGRFSSMCRERWPALCQVLLQHLEPASRKCSDASAKLLCRPFPCLGMHSSYDSMSLSPLAAGISPQESLDLDICLMTELVCSYVSEPLISCATKPTGLYMQADCDVTVSCDTARLLVAQGAEKAQ